VLAESDETVTERGDEMLIRRVFAFVHIYSAVVSSLRESVTEYQPSDFQ